MSHFRKPLSAGYSSELRRKSLEGYEKTDIRFFLPFAAYCLPGDGQDPRGKSLHPYRQNEQYAGWNRVVFDRYPDQYDL